MVDIANLRMMDYMVHFKFNGVTTLYFEAYPIIECLNIETLLKGEGWVPNYMDKDDSSGIESFDEDKCLKHFEGSYGWRGVWEGRLYFTEEEYWGYQILIMSELYNNCIVPFCKEYIIKLDPEIPYHGF